MRWHKLNYPNRHDAERGFSRGWLTAPVRDAIARDWAARQPTDQKTRLGGGIGFHGWASEWDGADGGYQLSWGCVVMHSADIAAMFERVPVGATVVLF